MYSKITRVMKSYKKNLPYFSSAKVIEFFKQSFIKQKSILLFSIRIEFSKQTKFYSNYKKYSACSFGRGSLRVQSNVLILVSSLAIVLARF